MTIDQEAKLKLARNKRDEKIQKKLERKEEIQCFWTAPLGHKWERLPNRYATTHRCVGCGKKKYGGSFF